MKHQDNIKEIDKWQTYIVSSNIVAILFDYGLKFSGLKTTTITSYLMFLPSKWNCNGNVKVWPVCGHIQQYCNRPAGKQNQILRSRKCSKRLKQGQKTIDKLKHWFCFCEHRSWSVFYIKNVHGMTAHLITWYPYR